MRLKVDIIVAAGGDNTVRAAKNATKTIPIVMVGTGSDPVEAGLIESLARPGGNLTGLTSFSRDLGGKRLELLKEAVTKLARVAVLYDPAGPASVREVKELLPVAARALRLTVRYWEIRDADGFERVFAALNKQRPDGLYVLRGVLMATNLRRIAGFALKSRFPSTYDYREAVDAGGLMYYGADLADSYRRVAYYVDKILKGAKPAELPVEQPTKFEFVINLKTAKQIGRDHSAKGAGAGRSGSQMTFSIADFGFSIKGLNHINNIFQTLSPLSGSGNPKSEIQNRKWAGPLTDPVGYGLIDSLAQQGGNITGSALAVGEGFSGKWVELLKETVPKVASIGRPAESNPPGRRCFSKRNAGGGQGARRNCSSTLRREIRVSLTALFFPELRKIALALSSATPDPLFGSQRKRIVDFAGTPSFAVDVLLQGVARRRGPHVLRSEFSRLISSAPPSTWTRP